MALRRVRSEATEGSQPRQRVIRPFACGSGWHPGVGARPKESSLSDPGCGAWPYNPKKCIYPCPPCLRGLYPTRDRTRSGDRRDPWWVT